MKKAILTAAFAALALGAAQAISISWSQTGDNITYGSDLTIRPTDQGAAYSAAICFSINEGYASTDNQKLAYIAQWASGSTQVFLDSDNSVRVQKFENGGTRNASLTVTPGETNVLVLTFDYPAATNEAQPTITAYLNGRQLWTIVSPYKAPGLSLNLTQSEAWTVSEVVAYEQVLSADQASWLYENKTAVLPEPTALALLALGVAGVALRRRTK